MSTFKALLIFTFMILSVAAQAVESTVMVIFTSGHSFSFSGGQNKTLKYGDKLTNGSDILVSDSSHLGFLTNDGERIYLSAGTQVRVREGFLELKKGMAWVQGAYQNMIYNVYTANAQVEVKNAYTVISYDEKTKETKSLNIRGESYFYNINDPNTGVEIYPGTFSIVNMNYNNGSPRKPIRVGEKSYESVKFAYNGVEAVEKIGFETIRPSQTVSARSIASIGSSKNTQVIKTSGQRGRVLFYKEGSGSYKGRSVASRPIKVYRMEESFDGSNPSQNTDSFIKKGRNITVYSIFENKEMKQTMSAPKKRAPASYKRVQRLPAQNIKKVNSPSRKRKSSAFEKSLNKKFKSNKRHSKDVNTLINELKTYKSQYQLEY